jgi:hypothetical protein
VYELPQMSKQSLLSNFGKPMARRRVCPASGPFSKRADVPFCGMDEAGQGAHFGRFATGPKRQAMAYVW